MMKRTIFSLLLLLVASGAFAQDRAAERTYISTDRNVYVAGEPVWCSAFCLDANHGGVPTKLSSTVYIELHGPQGLVQTAKLALANGRGGGKFTLPNTLPTGNYRLIAYTAQNCNEEGYDFEGPAAKTISVFNVLSTERTPGGVEVVDEAQYEQFAQETAFEGTKAGNVTVMAGAAAGGIVPVTVSNAAAKGATLSVSVYNVDGIAENDNPTVADFVQKVAEVGNPSFSDNRIADYEGEVIRGHVAGFSPELAPQVVGEFAFISAPGEKTDIYTSRIDADGNVIFFTGNIYGDKELICEIEGIDSLLNCHIELESPFVNPSVKAASPLKISDCISDAVLGRGVAMQIGRRFDTDTLFEFLPVRDNGFLEEDCVQYILDHYTRFPLMEEVFIEFVSEISARNYQGDTDIRIRLSDNYRLASHSPGSSLILLDGVPIFDQSKILNYDPLLVESINIYPHTHYAGKRVFGGVANFVTYKRNLPSMKFNGNVRIVNYQGTSFPQACTCAAAAGNDNYPDYRRTVYWHPEVNLQPEKDFTFNCVLPDYKGKFVVVVEGLDADGAPIYTKTSFEAH